MAITGDLTMRARHHEFAAACHWIQSLDVPVTVEVGNHDMPYFNLIERFFAPYRRFRAIEGLIEREIDLPGIAIVPLKTAVRAQPRLNWSKGWVSQSALRKCLAAIDALPPGTKALVTVHHPLREVGTKGTALTAQRLQGAARAGPAPGAGGAQRPRARSVRPDRARPPNGPVRMIGAGTLSQRIRSTPPSFNELTWDGATLKVRARNLDEVPTRDMQIDDVPENALPPREPGEPVAPVNQVPRTDRRCIRWAAAPWCSTRRQSTRRRGRRTRSQAPTR